MTTTILKVEGMACQACVGHVSRALAALAGVQSVAVDLVSGQATVGHGELDPARLVEAVEEEGYSGQILLNHPSFHF